VLTAVAMQKRRVAIKIKNRRCMPILVRRMNRVNEYNVRNTPVREKVIDGRTPSTNNDTPYSRVSRNKAKSEPLGAEMPMVSTSSHPVKPGAN